MGLVAVELRDGNRSQRGFVLVQQLTVNFVFKKEEKKTEERELLWFFREGGERE